ncbi:isochorismatase family protein [Luteolibacter sp. GHJ8]|uniref:Isochorismatase family protein n=1 Tax=Luteolibacter rhizosphaerae TaxID=2989719 RepID=A0ABT3FZD6_9BACT|nr:isochorismatase family protein [Luteolibacter rhizosphaerae]MCW1912942.1 isochorismatase family protein [Luteolibacter rhizosphaerae]
MLLDVINDMNFPGSADLLKRAVPAAKQIAHLGMRAHAAGIPVIYVNDNFGRWQSDFQSQIRRSISLESPGRDVALLLIPEKDDYFVLKPKHSGFYSTSLEVLLRFLGAETLILTGFAADICVLYTANDAYMRDYAIIVAKDCVASETDAGTRGALGRARNVPVACSAEEACFLIRPRIFSRRPRRAIPHPARDRPGWGATPSRQPQGGRRVQIPRRPPAGNCGSGPSRFESAPHDLIAAYTV